jgi:dienelactone hydrolase
MFGNGATAKDHTEAGKLMNALMSNPDALGRVKAAFDVVTKRPECDAAKLAAIGYCMGGSMALRMARAGLPVRGVAAFHAGLKPESAPVKGKTIGAKILVCVGADDPMISPADVAAFEDEMRQAKADYQVIIYGGARHAFTNPNADKAGLPALKYDPNADRRSWEALKDFLAELF